MCDNCSWTAALERITEAEEMLADMPDGDAASDFADGVGERLADMKQWIVENSHVTPGQEEAIENMAAGIERWLR